MPVCRWHHDAIGRYPGYAHQAGYTVLRHEDPRRVRVVALVDLPVAARLRFTRPAFDYKAMAPFVEAEHAKMGPEWGTW